LYPWKGRTEEKKMKDRKYIVRFSGPYLDYGPAFGKLVNYEYMYNKCMTTLLYLSGAALKGIIWKGEGPPSCN
jgi:hypothetical protein